MGIGTTELLLILLIVLVLFGAKKIPELMKGLGSGIRNFRNEMGKDDENIATNQQNTTQQPQANGTTTQVPPTNTKVI